MRLPLMYQHRSYHWVYELDTVVICWVMTSRNHNTNGLSMKLLAAKGREEANTEDDRIEEFPVIV